MSMANQILNGAVTIVMISNYVTILALGVVARSIGPRGY